MLKTVIASCNYVTVTVNRQQHSKNQLDRGTAALLCSKKDSHFSLAKITHKGVGQMVFSVSTSCLELAENEQYHFVKTAARSEPPSEENTCLQYGESLRDTP